MRRKLNLGFLAIILLLWAICVFTILSSKSIREVFIDLEADAIPGAIKMTQMKYETAEIRHWTLTYIIRGNVVRDGKTIKEWLQEEWTTLEKDAREHLEHERPFGFEKQQAAEEIVDVSQELWTSPEKVDS